MDVLRGSPNSPIMCCLKLASRAALEAPLDDLVQKGNAQDIEGFAILLLWRKHRTLWLSGLGPGTLSPEDPSLCYLTLPTLYTRSPKNPYVLPKGPSCLLITRLFSSFKDRKFASDARAQPIIRASLRAALVQGFKGTAKDGQIYATPWGFELKDV